MALLESHSISFLREKNNNNSSSTTSYSINLFMTNFAFINILQSVNRNQAENCKWIGIQCFITKIRCLKHDCEKKCYMFGKVKISLKKKSFAENQIKISHFAQTGALKMQNIDYGQTGSTNSFRILVIFKLLPHFDQSKLAIFNFFFFF